MTTKYANRIIIADILKKHKEKFTFRKKSCILYQYGRKRAPQMKHGRNIMTLGLCMIVKNEEEVLERCLQSAAGVFDHIAIADTGSSDNTKEIAKKYTDIVADYRWQDDFAAARNFSFSLSPADYIMWLDADDVLLPADKEALKALKKRLDGSTDAYMLLYRMGEDKDALVYYRERIVKRSRGFLWQGAVHEAVCVFGKVEYLDIAVTHKKPAERAASCRNLCIYAKQFSRGKTPNERQKFYFARELYANGLYDTAAAAYEWFLRGNGWTENKICACRDLAACRHALGERKKQLAALLKSFEYAPPRPEICCDLGAFFFEEKDYRQAIFWYKLAVNEKSDPKTGAFVQPDYNGYIPYIWLAVCYDRLGEHEQAFRCNEKAGEYKPGDKSYLHNKIYFENLLKRKGKNL